MSGPIQNVYFTNPIVESQIATINSEIDQIQTDIGYGQTLSTNCGTYLANQAVVLQNRNPIYGGTGGVVPSNFQNITVAGTPSSLAALVPTAYTGQGGHPGYYIAGGNYRTGEQYFGASNRPVNANSDTWNFTGTLYNFGSATKIIAGAVCAKMMEEGIIKASDFCYQYYPNMSGTAQYFTNVVINSGAAFPFAAASYTATTGTFDLATLTIKNLINYNIGLLNDFFILPNAVFGLCNSASINPVLTNANSGANIVGLAQYIQFATLSRSLLQNNPVGPVSNVYNGNNSYITNAALDQLISNTRSGVMPFAFKPGSWQNDLLPFNIRSQQSVYDAGFALLGIVLDGAIKQKTTYTCFADYARAKILTPLGMNDTYFVNQDTITEAQLSKYKVADNAFRRSAGFGGANYFWSTSLTGAGYNAFTGTNNRFQGNEATFATLVNAGLGFGSTSAEDLRSQYGFIANSYGCSTKYSTGAVSQLKTAQATYLAQLPFLPGSDKTGTASLAVGTFTAGPLAWSSQYPDDGISRTARGVFYNLTGSTSNYPISAAPVLSTVSDMTKFLKMVGNKGVGANGARVLKTESWSYLTSVKVSSLAQQGDNQRMEEEVYGNKDQNDFDFPNSGYCLGCYRTNRDITTNTIYGFDENTLFNGGATGNGWVVDLYTGNYYVYGTPEISISSGTISQAGGSRTADSELSSDILVQLIRD